MITPDWSQVRIIDWGLAAFVAPEMDPKLGSRTIRSLEMLMGCPRYGTGGDVWAVGVLIFYVLCGGVIPWKARNSWDTILGIAAFVDTKRILAIAKQLGVAVPGEIAGRIQKVAHREWKDAFDSEVKHLVDRKLIDLMKRLLTLEMEKRPTAAQALSDSFFRGK
jgi:serine/threonine protein kinase